MDMKDYRPVGHQECYFKELSGLMECDIREDLVFRGASSVKYDLTPSAYRPDKKPDLKKMAECYLSKQFMFTIDENVDLGMVFYEVAVLLWLHSEANKKGLPVPDIPDASRGNEFLDAQKLSFNLDGSRFIAEWSEIAAFAQHYGIPTRMLDWTTDMNMALNFAVKELKDKGPNEDYVELWVLNKSKVALLDSEIKFVTTKYHDNKNITDQQGLFTVIEGNNPGENLETVIERCYSNAKLHRIWDTLIPEGSRTPVF